MCEVMHPKYFDCFCDCGDCAVLDCDFVNKAVRKQIAKEPNISKTVFRTNLYKGEREFSYECPTCKKTVYHEDDYCKKCGQKIDWGEQNE